MAIRPIPEFGNCFRPDSTIWWNLVPPPGDTFRVNAGGDDYFDTNGNLFAEDVPFVAGSFGAQGGTAISIAGAIAGTEDDELFQSLRFDTESFGYVFDDVTNGTYEITLHFAHPDVATDAVFDVFVEGAIELDNVDVVAAAGGVLTAHSETVIATVFDGTLNIDFEAEGSGVASVAAIEVVQI